MKKIIYTLIGCFVFGLSYAAVVKYQEVAVGSIVKAQEIAIGSAVDIEEVTNSNSCPDYYADANVTFSWDGDHSSGTKYGCKSDGSTILGTGSLTPNTSYGESGSYGLRLDGANHLLFATSGDAQIDDTIGTIWMRLRIDDDPAPIAEVTLFEGAVDGTVADSIFMKLATANMWGIWGDPASSIYANSGTITTGASFQNVGYSWDCSSTNHSANPGDGTWDEDAGEISCNLANFNQIVIGENDFDKNAPTSFIYVDRIVILSTYEAALPTNW